MSAHERRTASMPTERQRRKAILRIKDAQKMTEAWRLASALEGLISIEPKWRTWLEELRDTGYADPRESWNLRNELTLWASMVAVHKIQILGLNGLTAADICEKYPPALQGLRKDYPVKDALALWDGDNGLPWFILGIRTFLEVFEKKPTLSPYIKRFKSNSPYGAPST